MMKKTSFREQLGLRALCGEAPAFRIRLMAAALAVCAAALSSCLKSPEKQKYLLLMPHYTFTLPEEIVPYTQGVTLDEPGALYSVSGSVQGDVVYLAGNLPVIITVPHGGSLEPADIANRADDPDWSSAYNTANDAATIDLACDIVEAFMNLTYGRYPHVIINNLSRSKIDQNRAWGDECNPTAGRGGEAWTDFHETLTASVAIERVLDEFGRGLYIDLHGKPNSGSPDYSLYWESVMIGYNLFGSVLSTTDDSINNTVNGYAEKSSLRFLSAYVPSTIDFAELLRGAVRGHESFGALLQNGLDEINRRYDRDYTVVPSDEVPEPEYLYLSGEYNVRAFCGVRDADAGLDNLYGYTDSRFISGFQLEASREIRTSDPGLRKAFAREVAEAAVLYLARHYRLAF